MAMTPILFALVDHVMGVRRQGEGVGEAPCGDDAQELAVASPHGGRVQRCIWAGTRLPGPIGLIRAASVCAVVCRAEDTIDVDVPIARIAPPIEIALPVGKWSRRSDLNR